MLHSRCFYFISIAIYESSDLNCPGGTVCCQGLNRCDTNGCTSSQPPTLPASSLPVIPDCSFVPDNQMVCTSGNTFNFCYGNGKDY